MFTNIRRWDLIIMFVLMGSLFVVEMLGVFFPHMVTITRIVKAYISIPVRVMILAWLNWHFLFSDIVKMLTPVK